MFRPFVFATLILGFALAARAASPIVMSHTGYLLDRADAPINDSALPMTFRLFDKSVPINGEVKVFEASCPVRVQHGQYSVMLGGSACGPGLDTSMIPIDAERYLEIAVQGITLLPRLMLGTVPTAAIAATSLDAQALTTKLKSEGSLNAAANPVDWSQLKNVPSGLADGSDDGNTYAAAAGGGLSLAGTAFGIAPGGVTNDLLASDGLSLARVSAGALQMASGDVVATGSITISGTGKRFAGDGSGLTNVPASGVSGLAAIATSGSWSELVGRPSTFAPSAHGHAAAEIGDFGAAALGAVAGTLTPGKWCSTDGSKITCTNDPPTSAASTGTTPAVACSSQTAGTFWFDRAASAVKVCNGASYVTVNTVTAPPIAPGAPTLLGGNGTLSVSWGAVAGAESYEIGYAIGSSLGGSPTTVTVPSGTAATLSSLTNGTTYAVAVRSAAGTYRSSWSSVTTGAPTTSGFTVPDGSVLETGAVTASATYLVQDVPGNRIAFVRGSSIASGVTFHGSQIMSLPRYRLASNAGSVWGTFTLTVIGGGGAGGFNYANGGHGGGAGFINAYPNLSTTASNVTFSIGAGGARTTTKGYTTTSACGVSNAQSGGTTTFTMGGTNYTANAGSGGYEWWYCTTPTPGGATGGFGTAVNTNNQSGSGAGNTGLYGAGGAGGARSSSGAVAAGGGGGGGFASGGPVAEAGGDSYTNNQGTTVYGGKGGSGFGAGGGGGCGSAGGDTSSYGGAGNPGAIVIQW